jgi:hypothetical protein
MNGAVVELAYTADSKSAARRACGFKSRPRYQIKKRKMKVSKGATEALKNILSTITHEFNALVGNIYYLYEREDGTFFISLVEPECWGSKNSPLTFVSEVIYAQNNDWKPN